MVEFAKTFYVAPLGDQVLVYWEYDESLGERPWVIRMQFQIGLERQVMAYCFAIEANMVEKFIDLNQERVTELYDILRRDIDRADKVEQCAEVMKESTPVQNLRDLFVQELKRLEISHYKDVWEGDGFSFLRIHSDEKGGRRLSVEFLFDEAGDTLEDIELTEELIDDGNFKVSQPRAIELKVAEDPKDLKGIHIHKTDEETSDIDDFRSSSFIHQERQELTHEFYTSASDDRKWDILNSLKALNQEYNESAQAELERARKGGSH